MAKATEPIYNEKDFARVMSFWREQGHARNYALICVLFLTALRVSDAIRLTWSDFYTDKKLKNCKECLFLRERKTKKVRQIDITGQLREILSDYKAALIKKGIHPALDDFLF